MQLNVRNVKCSIGGRVGCGELYFCDLKASEIQPTSKMTPL